MSATELARERRIRTRVDELRTLQTERLDAALAGALEIGRMVKDSVPVKLPRSLVERARRLAPLLAEDPKVRPLLGRVSAAAVIRIVVHHEHERLERRYLEDSRECWRCRERPWTVAEDGLCDVCAER